MSLRTWMQTYYPITALKAAELPLEDVVEHSLRKWIGLRKENLDRHGVRADYKIITDGLETLEITTDTCSLCCKFYEGLDKCSDCPLFTILGGSCARVSNCPYLKYTHNHDPEPMIEALEKTLESVRGGNPEQKGETPDWMRELPSWFKIKKSLIEGLSPEFSVYCLIDFESSEISFLPTRNPDKAVLTLEELESILKAYKKWEEAQNG